MNATYHSRKNPFLGLRRYRKRCYYKLNITLGRADCIDNVHIPDNSNARLVHIALIFIHTLIKLYSLFKIFILPVLS